MLLSSAQHLELLVNFITLIATLLGIAYTVIQIMESRKEIASVYQNVNQTIMRDINHNYFWNMPEMIENNLKSEEIRKKEKENV